MRTSPDPSAELGVAKEEVRRERHVVAQPAAEDFRDRHAPRLAENVEARELERREHLRAMVVERRRRVGDLEAQLLELCRIVSDDVGLERREGRRRAFAAAAHLAQPDETVVGLHLDDGAHEATPVAPVRVAKGRSEGDTDRRSPDVDDLHAAARASNGMVSRLKV